MREPPTGALAAATAGIRPGLGPAVLRRAAARLLGAMPAGGDVRQARRAMMVNFVALCGVAACAVFLAYDLLMAVPLGSRFIVQTAIFAVLFALVVPLNRRHPSLAAAVLIGLVLAVTISQALQGGRNAGTHYFLFILGPLLPLFFGSRRIPLIVALTGLAALVFLAIEFTVPSLVYTNRPWLPQLRNPFTESLDIDFDDVIFILSIVLFQAISTASTLVAVRVAENAEKALEREYSRSEMLLQTLLPRPIAARLKEQPDGVIADQFAMVTVLFADVVGFTPRASSRPAEEIVAFLTRIFAEFDRLAEKHGLEKIKTIGDAYMVAGGLPESGGQHTRAVAEMALDMIEVSQRLTAETGEDVSVRIGFHAGPAVAGVIGRRKPFYDVWGDTINVAARMESSGTPGRIQITPEVKAILADQFAFEERGTVEVKGKGPMSLFYLTGRREPGAPTA